MEEAREKCKAAREAYLAAFERMQAAQRDLLDKERSQDAFDCDVYRAAQEGTKTKWEREVAIKDAIAKARSFDERVAPLFKAAHETKKAMEEARHFYSSARFWLQHVAQTKKE